MGREKGNPQTVGYLGAILQGRSAVIFKELMAGEKKNTSFKVSLFCNIANEVTKFQPSNLLTSFASSISHQVNVIKTSNLPDKCPMSGANLQACVTLISSAISCL